MFTLKISPVVADGINLTAEEMHTLRSVRQRAEDYLSANPKANCDPQLRKHIEEVSARINKEIEDAQNFRKSLK